MKLVCKKCPVLGIDIVWENRTKRIEASPSIERIDSSKGYEPGNVALISWRANRIKKDASLQELEAVYARGFVVLEGDNGVESSVNF